MHPRRISVELGAKRRLKKALSDAKKPKRASKKASAAPVRSLDEEIAKRERPKGVAVGDYLESLRAADPAPVAPKAADAAVLFNEAEAAASEASNLSKQAAALADDSAAKAAAQVAEAAEREAAAAAAETAAKKAAAEAAAREKEALEREKAAAAQRAKEEQEARDAEAARLAAKAEAEAKAKAEEEAAALLATQAEQEMPAMREAPVERPGFTRKLSSFLFGEQEPVAESEAEPQAEAWYGEQEPTVEGVYVEMESERYEMEPER